MYMNKRILIAVLATSLILTTGCFRKKKDNSSSSGNNSSGNSSMPISSQQSELPSGSEVTIYLNLGEIGLYNGEKGQEYPDMFLENAIKLDTTVGAALPGKDVITSTSGAVFNNWMAYEGEGAPTKYETAPGFNNKILLADFGGGSGGGGGGSIPEGDITYTCTDLPNWIKDNDCVIFAWAWKAGQDGSWKATTYDGDTALHFTVDGELQGFLLARCVAGTTTPDWSATGNNPGRVYNQTEDISCSSGTYSYTCSSWKEYTPSV